MNHINLESDYYDARPLFKLEMAKYRLSFSTKIPIDIQQLVAFLRSKLGYILKKRFCPFQNYQSVPCKGCRNSPDCLYTILFSPTLESIVSKFKGKGKSHHTPPRPYFLDVLLLNNGTKMCAEELGQIELTLLGREAIQYQRPMLESIFNALASIPIEYLSTDTDNSNSGTKSLIPIAWEAIVPEKKEQNWQLVSKGKDYIATGAMGKTLEEWISALPRPVIPTDNQGISMLDVLVRTPLQLGLDLGKLTFTVFIQLIMRRLRNLKRIYHPDNDMGDFPEIFYINSNLVSTFNNLETIRLSWHSYSQKKNIQIGGLQGSLIFKGDIEPFLPLLVAGSLIGIGKKVVYGLGRFDLP
jgi:hypothetical protein